MSTWLEMTAKEFDGEAKPQPLALDLAVPDQLGTAPMEFEDEES